MLRPGETVASPHDSEARFRMKREMTWTGYQVHLTETCDEDLPRLILNVETTIAADTEFDALPQIHHDLAARDLLPSQHIVDGGYSSSDGLVASQTHYAVELLCPAPRDQNWQARTAGALDLTRFQIDWANQQVTCPMGKVNQTWRCCPASKSPHKNVYVVRFRTEDCAACPARALCTRGQGARSVTLLVQAEFEALQQARQRQQTDEFAANYAARAGAEGTISQCVQRAGIRRSRYVGLAKTHLQRILTAVAVNIVRAVNWLMGVP